MTMNLDLSDYECGCYEPQARLDQLIAEYDIRRDALDGPNEQIWEMAGTIGELAATIDLHEGTILDQAETIADQAKTIQSLLEDVSIYKELAKSRKIELNQQRLEAEQANAQLERLSGLMLERLEREYPNLTAWELD